MTTPLTDDNLIGKLFLRKWHPQATIPCAQIIFGIIGTICLVFGVAITCINAQIVEVRVISYNEMAGCASASYNSQCSITVSMPSMSGPVFMYYELSNFYQNHRRYVKSRNNIQLSNVSISKFDISKTCDGVTHNSDLFDWQRQNYLSKNNTITTRLQILDQDAFANPCGLIARSFFNDTYSMFSANGTQVNISETGIAWPNQAGSKYKTGGNTSWIDVENEHFIIWMTTSGLPQFRKLWGHIDAGFTKGLYTITVQNNYDPRTFDGQKNLFFSTADGFGGRDNFLGTAYLIVGSLIMCAAIFFQVYSAHSGKKYGQKSE